MKHDTINIFLDLEETVIDDWYSGNFLPQNIDRISDLIKKFSIEYNSRIASNNNVNLILFSAAVTNQKDLDFFNLNFKITLEEKLGFKFNSEFLFSDENYFELALKNGIQMLDTDTVHDIFMFNPKEEIFNLIAIENEVNILFDDTVRSKITFGKLNFFNTDTAQTIKIYVDCSNKDK